VRLSPTVAMTNALCVDGPLAKSKSHWTDTLAFHIRSMRLPEPLREHWFHGRRKWRFDFAWPDHMLAVEFEGGVFVQGRHSRGAGFEADCEKYNTATLSGWRVLRFTSNQVKSGQAVTFIQQALDGRFVDGG